LGHDSLAKGRNEGWGGGRGLKESAYDLPSAVRPGVLHLGKERGRWQNVIKRVRFVDLPAQVGQGKPAKKRS